MKSKLLVGGVSAILLLCVCALADDDPLLTRPSLRGLKAVAVSIRSACEICARPTKPGLVDIDDDAIRTDVELKLRKAGILIAPADKVLKDGGAFLSVEFTILSVGSEASELYPFHLAVQVEQPAWLARESSILAPSAVTWSVGTTGIVGADRIHYIRNALSDLTDKFLNAYLSVNSSAGVVNQLPATSNGRQRVQIAGDGADDLHNPHIGWFPYLLGALEANLEDAGVDAALVVQKPRLGDHLDSLPGVLRLLRSEADQSLLYVSIEPLTSPERQRIRVRCLAADGKLLWEESVSGVLPDAPPADALLEQLTNQLKLHIGKSGLPLR